MTTIQGAAFDGSSFLAGALTGAVDGKQGIFFKVIRPTDNSNDTIFKMGGVSIVRLGGSDQRIVVTLKNAAGTVINKFRSSVGSAPDGAQVSVLVGWDQALGNAGRFLFVNDVSDLIHQITAADDLVDYTSSPAWVMSENGNIAAGTAEVGILYLNTEVWMDFAAVANRRLFNDIAGLPVDLGADGSFPTGTVPILLLEGEETGFPDNQGTGGGLTLTGTLGPASFEGAGEETGGGEGTVSVAVGTVTTVAPGQPATVENVGTPQDVVLDFGLPQGDAGPPGADSTVPGPEGPAGPAGADSTVPGPQGPAGPATIAIGGVTTLEPGEPATVANSGTPEAMVLEFGIPKGVPGSGAVFGQLPGDIRQFGLVASSSQDPVLAQENRDLLNAKMLDASAQGGGKFWVPITGNSYFPMAPGLKMPQGIDIEGLSKWGSFIWFVGATTDACIYSARRDGSSNLNIWDSWSISKLRLRNPGESGQPAYACALIDLTATRYCTISDLMLHGADSSNQFDNAVSVAFRLRDKNPANQDRTTFHNVIEKIGNTGGTFGTGVHYTQKTGNCNSNQIRSITLQARWPFDFTDGAGGLGANESVNLLVEGGYTSANNQPADPANGRDEAACFRDDQYPLHSPFIAFNTENMRSMPDPTGAWELMGEPDQRLKGQGNLFYPGGGFLGGSVRLKGRAGFRDPAFFLLGNTDPHRKNQLYRDADFNVKVSNG